MGFNCLKATATSRRQSTFYHSVPRNSWYSFYRPRKGERLSRPWGHPVVLSTGLVDWESSALTTRPLLHKVIERFSEVAFKWFDFNYMKIHSGKSHILFSGNDNVSANIDYHTIISENKNELLGIILDSKLSFEDHINNLCKKASQKLNTLARIAPYMCLEKRKTVMKAYVASQFGYCPLVWMFHKQKP